MAKAIYEKWIIDQNGNAVVGAEYDVINESTGLDLTPIYSDRNGASIMTPPYLTDANGLARFYVDPGVTFKVEVTGGSGTGTSRYNEGRLFGTEDGETPTNEESNSQRIKYVQTIAGLPVDATIGQAVHVNGFHTGNFALADPYKGGGDFTLAEDMRHNGGTIIDPTRTFPTDWSDAVQVAAWFADSGIDADCFVRNDVEITASMWGSGQFDDSIAIDRAYSVLDELVFDIETNIDNDLAIAATKKAIFTSGYLNITGTATVTIDALIDSPEQWIFRGTGNVQATNMYQNNYPSNEFNKNSRVYAKWFGVINDAEVKTYYSPAGEAAGSTVFGTPPVGTDSTSAMKQAILYCEQASRKVDTFSYSDNTPELILPTGAIYVNGDNPFGAQLLKTDVEAAYADADLGNVPTLSDELRFSSHKIIITGQDTVVFWNPLAVDDKFINAYFYVDGLFHSNYTVLPLVAEGDAWGTLIYNLALGPRGGTSSYRNSLTKIFFNNVRCLMSANDAKSAMTSDKFSAIDTVMRLEGYARADQINFTNCHFRAFKTGVRCDNPEAVLHNYINTWFIPTTLFPSIEKVVFHFTSFFGGFQSTGCYYGLKTSNVTLLKTEYRTDNYIGNSEFADSVYDFTAGNRMEGLSGGTGITLYDGYRGTALFDGWNVSNGGSHASGQDAVLTNRARAIFKNGQYYGKYTLDETMQTFESPIQYIDSNFALSLPTSGGTYGSSSYFFTVIANAEFKIPSVYFNNCTPVSWLPIPKYYGSTHNSVGELTSATIADTANTSRLRIGQSSVSNPFDDEKNLPMHVVIEELEFSLSSHPTSAFDGLRITFTSSSGSYVLNTVLTGVTVTNQSIMPSGKWITTSRDSTSVSVELTKTGAPVSGSHPGSIRLKYRPMIKSSDVLTTSTYEPHEIDISYY